MKKNSVMVSKLILNTDKLEEYITRCAPKTKRERQILTLKWIEQAGKQHKPYPVTIVNGDSSSSIAYSRGVRVIGVDNLGTINYGGILSFSGDKIIPASNTIAEIDDSLRTLGINAFASFMGRVYECGLIDQNGRMWDFAVQSAKQSQTGRGIVIADGHYADPMYDMGFSEIQFADHHIKKWFKVKMNYFSGQLMFADEAYNAAPITMMDCRGFIPPVHRFHVSRVERYDTDGRKTDPKWDVVETRPGDAVIYVIREMLPIKALLNSNPKMTPDEAVDLIEKGISPDVSLWEKLGAQIRGAAMKGFGLDVPVITLAKAMALAEGDKHPQLTLADGRKIDVSIRSFAREGLYCLVSQDVMKYGEGRTEEFRDFANPENAFLEACAFVRGKQDLKTYVSLSRQILTTYAIGEEEVSKLLNLTRSNINRSKTSETIDTLGIGNSIFAKTVVENAFNSALKTALFGKLIVKGTFAFAISEPRPMIAHIMGYDYRHHMSLRGSQCYFGGAGENEDVLCAHRYPTLTFSALVLRIIKSRDAELYCLGILILSWDTLYNVVLKGDYDGDTPLVCLPINKEENEFILINFDFDLIFIPDDGEEVEDLIDNWLNELTVSTARFAEAAAQAIKSEKKRNKIIAEYAKRRAQY